MHGKFNSIVLKWLQIFCYKINGHTTVTRLTHGPSIKHQQQKGNRLYWKNNFKSHIWNHHSNHITLSTGRQLCSGIDYGHSQHTILLPKKWCHTHTANFALVHKHLYTSGKGWSQNRPPQAVWLDRDACPQVEKVATGSLVPSAKHRNPENVVARRGMQLSPQTAAQCIQLKA